MLVIIFGIETSCDETSIGIVSADGTLLSNTVVTQMALHSQYGGVIPEIASRQHILTVGAVIRQALTDAEIGWGDITAIAVTNGPGLAGSLLVGVSVAKGLALTTGLPLIGVNHIEGHIAAVLINSSDNVHNAGVHAVKGRLMCLVVSGGHTELVLWEGDQFKIVGQTLDDAAGEAFDKVARTLGLGYPGGPAIQAIAERGRDTKIKLPRPCVKGAYDFSFSGLKTASIRLAQSLQPLGDTQRAELAYAFQEATSDILVSKALSAAEDYACEAIVLGGGVASNSHLRHSLRTRSPLPVFIPPPRLCTDNGAMIAMRGLMLHRANAHSGLDLDIDPMLAIGSV